MLCDDAEAFLTAKAPPQAWLAAAKAHWQSTPERREQLEVTPYPEDALRRWPVLLDYNRASQKLHLYT